MTTLYDSRRPVNRNRFGAGILPPDRQWATDAEWRARREATTFSAAEWAALVAEAEAASLDRYHRQADADQAEADELGISPEAMEELAREAAELDRVCGIPTPAALAAAEPEVRNIEIYGLPYTVESVAPQSAEVVAQCRVTKVGGCGSWYDLARHADGRLSCDCPSFEFTHIDRGSPCKHLAAVLPTGMLDDPAPAPRKARPRTLHQAARARRLAIA